MDSKQEKNLHHSKKMKIGISLGDLGGINGDILQRALLDLHQSEFFKNHELVLIGEEAAYNEILKKLELSESKFNQLKEIEESYCTWYQPYLDTYDSESFINNLLAENPTIETLLKSGQLQFSYLSASIDLLKEKKIDAIVNCPVNKDRINNYLARHEESSPHYPFRGQTEFYARNFDKKHVVMSFMGEKIKVALMSTHLPLKDVDAYLTKEMIETKMSIVHQALSKLFGLENPKLAVCGLNPHSGENGLIGDFEQRELIPALNQLQANKIEIKGPYPADSYFFQHLHTESDSNKADIICTMYHDQGTVPFKLLHFDDGVNVTLGLDFIRCSTDHGPAYDIALKKVASHKSLLNAIKLAAARY